MPTSPDPNVESAKATQEVAKATGKAIDAAREAGTFISKYISGPLEQGMGIFEDRLRYMRWERQQRLMRRAEQVMKELGLAGPTRPVPLKLAVPLLQAASMEDDDTLQDLWVNLLVNAANANSGVDLQRSYIEILAQLGSLEASILDVIYSLPFSDTQHEGVMTGDLPTSARAATKEDKKEGDLPPPDVVLALANLARVGCIRPGMTWGGGESYKRVNPTVLGQAFVRACRTRRATET